MSQEKKTLPDNLAEQLKKPLPTEAIKPHPSKSFLSTINPVYVIERLNNVFGIGGWYFDTNVIREEGKMIVVKGELSIPEYYIRISTYGGNDNTDLGDAYKGAQTDALTKAASYLGIGMDVWKDKSKAAKVETNGKIPPSEEAKKFADDKPWLNENTKEFIKVAELTKEGRLDEARAILSNYKLSKAINAKLKELSKEAV